MFELLFLSLDETTSPQYKRRHCLLLSRIKSHPFQHLPRIIAQQHLRVPGASQRASSTLPLACVKGLYLFEVSLMLFINMTNGRRVEPLVKDKEFVHLTIYSDVLKERRALKPNETSV